MKLIENKIEMTTCLILNEREVKMLQHLAQYEGYKIAQAICGQLTNEFSAKEWNELWNSMECELRQTLKRFEDTKDVFKGRKIVAPLESK